MGVWSRRASFDNAALKLTSWRSRAIRFDESTNIEIGRGSGDQVSQLYKVASWCEKYGIKFKINTVVCRLNWDEDMNKHIEQLQPFRWKCFQVLVVAGETTLGIHCETLASSSLPMKNTIAFAGDTRLRRHCTRVESTDGQVVLDPSTST
ncbi:hypothetical protein AG0111_0g11779 [Alternaria gaisen]|uniref:Uncharacterized protein n=1 Tax=Alternaria gaisen TaxID=167740 RepID=A0ACB6F6R9_9PLEO|nr:hypothetical protein AG0111_0g11779 [Alternaria gaisen]